MQLRMQLLPGCLQTWSVIVMAEHVRQALLAGHTTPHSVMQIKAWAVPRCLLLSAHPPSAEARSGQLRVITHMHQSPAAAALAHMGSQAAALWRTLDVTHGAEGSASLSCFLLSARPPSGQLRFIMAALACCKHQLQQLTATGLTSCSWTAGARTRTAQVTLPVSHPWPAYAHHG